MDEGNQQSNSTWFGTNMSKTKNCVMYHCILHQTTHYVQSYGLYMSNLSAVIHPSRNSGIIFIFETPKEKKKQKLTANFIYLREHANIEHGEEQEGSPQQDSSVIIAAKQDRIGVCCERSIFLVISLPSRLISSTWSPPCCLKAELCTV